MAQGMLYVECFQQLLHCLVFEFIPRSVWNRRISSRLPSTLWKAAFSSPSCFITPRSGVWIPIFLFSSALSFACVVIITACVEYFFDFRYQPCFIRTLFCFGHIGTPLLIGFILYDLKKSVQFIVTYPNS